ncbi:hypothetical protein JCM11251_003129 [Rhodosporidiobolus azoricus]
MSTATARNQRNNANGFADAVLKPGADVRGRLVNVLLLSTLFGTAWSVISTSSATTAFRSRLPAHTLTRLQSSESAFPVPSLPFFADKRNPLNQLFVKRSWGWVTGLFLVLSLTLYLFHPHHPSTSNPASLTTSSRTSAARTGLTPTSRHILASLRRYLLATLFWFYLTQATWFGTRLGPSVAFRILRSSGAVCVPSAVSSDPHGAGSAGGLHGDGGGIPVCTGARGEYWRGGHDVSGHAFMMVHASMFLFEIVYPLLPSLFPSLFDAPPSPTVESTRDGADEGKRARPVAPRRINPIVAVVGYATVAVLVLCWWMLLMTSLFFHSPAEKLTGLAFGLLGWYVSSL